MNVLDEMDEIVKASKAPSRSLIAKAVRRMKRDRATIAKIEGLLRWYDAKVGELKEEVRQLERGARRGADLV
jgi:metal-responsive CopG/Arc/MetJ family transcriptional regulator